jgi:hypothetical protein
MADVKASESHSVLRQVDQLKNVDQQVSSEIGQLVKAVTRLDNTADKLTDTVTRLAIEVSNIQGQLKEREVRMGVAAVGAHVTHPTAAAAETPNPWTAFLAKWGPNHVIMLAGLLIGGQTVAGPFVERAATALFGDPTVQVRGQLNVDDTEAHEAADKDTEDLLVR